MPAEIELHGADVLAARLRQQQQNALELHKLTIRTGHLLSTRVKGKASGRPGPRAPTGDYRRSWNVDVAVVGDQTLVTVGTSKVQAMSLEYGFVGVDAIGRFQNRPPYPHLRPAIAEILPAFLAEARRIVGR